MKSSRAKIRRAVHKIPTIRFESDQRLTSYAGLVVFQALFQRLDLKNRLRRCFDHLQEHAIFESATIVQVLIVHLLLGFRRLRGLDYYRHDPLVARVVGLSQLPSVPTASRALSALDRRCVEDTRTLSRNLVLERLVTEGFARLTLDFDGSVQSTTGHAEGTAVGYNKVKKGARSYYPLFCTVAQTGQFFDLHHRSGNVHDSNGAGAFMQECFDRSRAAMPRATLEGRMDSAFFDQKVLTALNAANVDFTCSVPFERFPELKRMIEGRRLWEAIDDRWAFFESEWKPKSWDETYRFLFLRQRVANQQKGPLQLDLFEPKSFDYDYKVIVTNKTSGAKTVLLFHNGRGAQEKIFAEGKQHAGLDMIPTRTLFGNQIFTLASMLAHNLSRELQMSAAPQGRATLPKRPACWEFDQLGTIRQRLLHLAGRLTRPAGELTLTITENPVIRAEFAKYLPDVQLAP